ncbi:MAG: hypothetical protein LBT17_00810 [Mycoplasmataceae bacterium]|jgi:hypothetical protein|nr:hypothetical protein [Mycoplasmataceae bacterium]
MAKLTKAQNYILDDCLGCGDHEESVTTDNLIQAIEKWLGQSSDNTLKSLMESLDYVNDKASYLPLADEKYPETLNKQEREFIKKLNSVTGRVQKLQEEKRNLGAILGNDLQEVKELENRIRQIDHELIGIDMRGESFKETACKQYNPNDVRDQNESVDKEGNEFIDIVAINGSESNKYYTRHYEDGTEVEISPSVFAGLEEFKKPIAKQKKKMEIK